MISPTNLGLMFYSGAAIAGGQAFMSVLSRSFSDDVNAISMLRLSILSWNFWAAIFFYGSGMLSMFLLLRYLPLAQASVGIWAVTIVCNVLLTAALGQSIGLSQYIGIALVFVGMVFLQNQ